MASCFARYRSYNPEDNSYQPHGRRSRQQCE
ncbi:BA14K family protein [Mesorhizobium sp. IMUNJ 23232]